MKKPLVVAIIVLVAIVGSFVYLMSQDKAANESTGTVEVTETTTTPTPTGTTSANPGKYVDYDAAAVAATPGEKVLFFHASWCPQCRQLESEIKAGPLPDNTTIFKVDYDSNQALRQKYGVTLQTTLVKVDDQGNLVEKYVAYDDPTLAAIKENIL